MNESDWLTNADLQQMLNLLRGKVGERKLRLFAVASCRQVCHLLADSRLRHALETVEQYAESNATQQEIDFARAFAEQAREPSRAQAEQLAAEHDAAWRRLRPEQRRRWPIWEPLVEGLLLADATHCAAEATVWAATIQAEFMADPSTDTVQLAGVYAATADEFWRKAKLAEAGNRNTVAWENAHKEALQTGAASLRDIFGNPFRPITVDPAWRTATVVALTEAIYADRAFDRLPILADALEEAGCTSAELLSHCRQPGEHVRGCWAVDLVLGKA